MVAPQTSAADVLQSLAIDELEVASDHNNNSDRASHDSKQDTLAEALPLSPQLASITDADSVSGTCSSGQQQWAKLVKGLLLLGDKRQVLR